MKRVSLVAAGDSLFAVSATLILAVSQLASQAYPRYRDPVTGGGNCSGCHGAFTDSTSPKGTVFPSSSKHEMHRAGTSMATACNLCHSTTDNRNPFTYTSTGTASNQGLGCSGCHVGAGLRAHHVANGVNVCLDCHLPEVSAPENVKPPYYGTIDTRVDHPENLVRVANTNENWSVGDFLGLDNDGNNLYDAADFACAPYQIVSVIPVDSAFQITWQTAGGRRDAVQASAAAAGPYTNIFLPLAIAGVGIIVTNYVDASAPQKGPRFYRLNYQP
jgi:hypothetical protein